MGTQAVGGRARSFPNPPFARCVRSAWWCSCFGGRGRNIIAAPFPPGDVSSPQRPFRLPGNLNVPPLPGPPPGSGVQAAGPVETTESPLVDVRTQVNRDGSGTVSALRTRMHIELHVQGNTLSISGVKELNAANADSFRDQIRAALSESLRNIEIDLSQARFLDSGGLGALVSLHKTACGRNGRVRLVNPTIPVKQILALTRMHRIFEIVQSRPEVGVTRLTLPEIAATEANGVGLFDYDSPRLTLPEIGATAANLTNGTGLGLRGDG